MWTATSNKETNSMYERFTDRARKVMQLANQEAQRFNHEYIGTEHILLGLVKEGDGAATFIFNALGVDPRKIRLEVEKRIYAGPDVVESGKLPHTPRAKKVIEYAVEEARNLKHNYIGTEHLLLGLLREQEGVAAQVLMNLSLKLDEVREVVCAMTKSTVPDNVREPAVVIDFDKPVQIVPDPKTGALATPLLKIGPNPNGGGVYYRTNVERTPNQFVLVHLNGEGIEQSRGTKVRCENVPEKPSEPRPFIRRYFNVWRNPTGELHICGSYRDRKEADGYATNKDPTLDPTWMRVGVLEFEPDGVLVIDLTKDKSLAAFRGKELRPGVVEFVRAPKKLLEAQIKDNGVWVGEQLMGEIDGDDFVPSKHLLMQPPAVQQQVDELVRKARRAPIELGVKLYNVYRQPNDDLVLSRRSTNQADSDRDAERCSRPRVGVLCEDANGGLFLEAL